MEDKLVKKPTPSKSQGKKGSKGQIPPTQIPKGVKKPTPWEPAPGLVPLNGKIYKYNN